MINQFDLTTRIVDAIHSIPDIGDFFRGDLHSRVVAFHDSFPGTISLARSIVDMPQPGILVVWAGTQAGGGTQREAFVHSFQLILRAEVTSENVNFKDYPGLWVALMDGVPTLLDGQPFRRAEFDPDLYPMNTPSIERRSLILSQEVQVDYYQVTIAFEQIGDD